MDKKNNFQRPRNLIAWFFYNHVAANILMLSLIVGGILSLTQIQTEIFPTIDPKTITVSVAYPGATPYEVADSITRRAEESLIGIEGVKRIYSTAMESYGVVTIELEEFANADDVYNDVETSINSLSDFPPLDAERPVIKKTKITPDVLKLALYGDVPEKTIKYWAETVKDKIRGLPDIALVTLQGVRNYQISIEITEENLRRYGLSIRQIGDIISRYSIDIPAGTIESNQGDILLRIQEKKYVGEDFKKIVIRTLEDGTKLFLGDIAVIIDEFEDINLISKYNNKQAAFIHVLRSSTQDALKVAKVVKDYIPTIKLPEGLYLEIQDDETDKLEERMSLMMRNAILGFMLVFLVLLLFLDLKLAFWTSSAIPISFLGGLMIIYFMGYSLNMISLFALIIVLGIVVDDAIVIGESIFEAQEKQLSNKTPINSDKHATLQGVYQVAAPVTIGVLTTMAAFAPLIWSSGTLGQIIRHIPLVVIPILFISLVEAYFILPAHLSSQKRWSVGATLALRNSFSKALKWFIKNILTPASKFAMSWRYATIAIFIAFIIITSGMLESGIIRFIFFPKIEGNTITVNISMERGTSFATTKEVMLEAEQEIAAIRDEISDTQADPFESIALSIGEKSSGGSPRSGSSLNSDNHIGQIVISLVSSDFRSKSIVEIENMLRKRIENIPGIEKLSFRSSIIGNDADIEIELSHNNNKTLNIAAQKLKEAIKKIEGTREVEDTFELGKTEFVFELTDEGLSVGLTPYELGQQLRSTFFGLEVQRFQRDNSEITVYVRLAKEQRETLEGLKNARIRLPNGDELPLSAVAKFKKQFAYSEIQTVNGRRIVSVTSNIDNTITTPNDVSELLTKDILPKLQENYIGLSYSFEGKSREQNEDLTRLRNNMLIILMVIYILLGGQLRSYIQPLIIMSAIPFGMTGAIWGHYLLGYDLSFFSIFGMVALTGVVINDSVILMDYYNKQKNNNSTFDALGLSIIRRFRPILLTTLTTSLGLLPMLLETSIQAQFLIPMVVSLATGILFSSVVILFLVPCLVLVVDDCKKLYSS